MKAVIVIDVDEEDIGRQVNYINVYINVKGGGMSYIIGAKDDHALIRPLPEKMTWGHTIDYIEGYNACLDEITGETE